VYRVGVVSEIDVEKARARVHFEERDDVNSGWLSVIQPKTLKDKVYWMPDIGEHVVCLLDEHDEDGALVGAIYSDVDVVPDGVSADVHTTVYVDGAKWKYDRSSSQWSLVVPAAGRVLIQVGSSSIEVIDGKITVTANTVLLAGSGATEPLVLGNSFKALFNAHTHPDPQGGVTGAPTVPMGGGHLSSKSFTE
jgi:phage baseplate assembly protein V